MKYGNLKVPVPSAEVSINALQELLDSGKIDRNTFVRQKDKVIRTRLMAIVNSNNNKYLYGSKLTKTEKQTIAEKKAQFREIKLQEFRDANLLNTNTEVEESEQVVDQVIEENTDLDQNTSNIPLKARQEIAE